jgi:electron transport complex protein RnfB
MNAYVLFGGICMAADQYKISEQDRSTYLMFIDWLKQSWYGVPDSAVLLPYVAARYTAEEAIFLTGLPFSPKTLDELSAIKKMSPDVLRPMLDSLAVKGLVYKQLKGDVIRYHLHDIFTIYRGFGWPGKTDDYSKTVGPLLHKYLMEGLMSPWRNVKEKGLRVLPIGVTIEDKRGVVPYEEAGRIFDKVEYFTVSHCPCRHANNLDPDTPDCKFPTEVCLHFDKLGHYIVENGMGREITRQEAEAILRQCADLGLVHGISNQQEKPDTICNCCSDCCIWFLTMKKYGHNGTLTPSNYRLSINKSACTGCGLCVKRCPMEALHLEDDPAVQGRETLIPGKDGKQSKLINQAGKISWLALARCIGCGVCAYKCPAGAISLERNQVEHAPPQTGRDWIMQFLTDTRTSK